MVSNVEALFGVISASEGERWREDEVVRVRRRVEGT